MPYAYQAGDNCYGRGDYYRGDYYRGDFLGIGKFIKRVASPLVNVATGLAKTFVPGLGTAVTIAEKVFSHAGHPNLPVPNMLPQSLQAGGQAIVQTGGLVNVGVQSQEFGPPLGGGGAMSLTPGGALVPCQVKGYRLNKHGYYRHPRGNPQSATYIPAKSVCVKSRRLNVANPRALRRAIRRAQGFAKLARRVLNFTSPHRVKGRPHFKRRKK
jgi:hypothetical protein